MIQSQIFLNALYFILLRPINPSSKSSHPNVFLPPDKAIFLGLPAKIFKLMLNLSYQPGVWWRWKSRNNDQPIVYTFLNLLRFRWAMGLR